MTVPDILKLEGWKDGRLSLTFEDSDLKSLERKAEEFHNDIVRINEVVKGYYCIRTFITGWAKTNHYKLKLKVKYYDDKSKQEHKNNIHEQKINL